MLDPEKMEEILDKYMLDFLDSYQEVYDELPTEINRRIWMSGFVAGCLAIEEAITGKEPEYYPEYLD